MNTRSSETLDAVLDMAQERQSKLEGDLQLLRSCVQAFTYASEKEGGTGYETLYWPDLMEIIESLIPSRESVEQLGEVAPKVRKILAVVVSDSGTVDVSKPATRRGARATDLASGPAQHAGSN